MKLFEHHTNQTTYKQPVIKVLVSISVMLACIFRYDVQIKWLSFLISVFCVIITAVSILCIYNAIADMFYAYSNRKKNQQKAGVISKKFNFEEIQRMLLTNNLIDINIVINGEIHSIGASAECERDSFIFFNKRYYFDNNDYKDFEDFISALYEHFPSGSVNVTSIDGIIQK